jgi:hypothetical protein
MPTDADSPAEVFRLLYVSDVAANPASVFRATVHDILITSVRNNRRRRITGFLLCDGARFVQVLEGGRGPVEACFAVIAADGRHEQVEVRTREHGPRAYPRWSMCAVTLSAQEDALLSAANIHLDLRRASAGALDQHMLGVAKRHARELDALHARLAAAAG